MVSSNIVSEFITFLYCTSDSKPSQMQTIPSLVVSPLIHHILLMQPSPWSFLQGAWVASRHEPMSKWKDCVRPCLVQEVQRNVCQISWICCVDGAGNSFKQNISTSVFTLPFNTYFHYFFLNVGIIYIYFLRHWFKFSPEQSALYKESRYINKKLPKKLAYILSPNYILFIPT